MDDSGKEGLGTTNPETDCLFCKIAKGEIPCMKLYEDQKILAFMDINPANNGHALVITKTHYEKFNDIDADDLMGLISVVQNVSKAVEKAVGMEGYNILMNNGSAAGQVVGHIHFHVIPRKTADSVNIKWDPIKLPDDEIKSITDNIKSYL